MRALRPKLAQRLARSAPLRYKLAGAGVALTVWSVGVPAASLAVDPYSESVVAFLAIGIASSVLLVWGYYVATGVMARAKVLDR